jgi:signal transduction histidine kinase
MMRKYGELRKKGESAPSVYEAKGLCKDGTEIDIEVTASAFEVAGQKYIIDINRNISERKNFEKKLKEQNLQLQKINAELDRFVYSASHDLRAPLRSMLGLIGLFRIDTDTNNYTNYLNRMEKSILSMDNFIQDIINYSRNARQEVCFETFNLHEIVVEMVEAIKHSSPIKIDVQYLYDHRFMLHSDKKRIKIILNNLLSNAFRYYDQDKSHNLIKINAQYVDNKYIISVEDNGIGIDTEHIDKIFNMFYRAHDHKVGSGLGLYIVKETVNVLRGEVTVESKLGEGSIFKIIL